MYYEQKVVRLTKTYQTIFIDDVDGLHGGVGIDVEVSGDVHELDDVLFFVNKFLADVADNTIVSLISS